MTNQDNNEDLSDRDSKLMDSLLQQTFQTESDASRVAAAMSAIRSESADVNVAAAAPKRLRVLRWLVPLAAGILVTALVLTQPGSSASAAMAALDRTIQAEEKLADREYAVTIGARRRRGDTRKTDHRLFVRKRSFAVCSPGLFGRGEVWFGGDTDSRWFVPKLGPVLVGAEAALKREISSNRVIETPFLSVSRILERTKRFYELTLESDVELKSGERTTTCQYIVGRRVRSPKQAIPERVEIWADPETGFARRVRLEWAETDDSRWQEATADLVATPTLAADFFEHTAHHDANRRVVHLK